MAALCSRGEEDEGKIRKHENTRGWHNSKGNALGDEMLIESENLLGCALV
jgi:hypothetical protein